MSIAHSITTAEQLFAAGDIGRCELVRGELIMMSPANPEHARIVARLSHLLLSYLDDSINFGELWAGDPGFIISRDPDTVRAPDLAIVQSNDTSQAVAQGFFVGTPVVAIKIISPSEKPNAVRAKVEVWLEAGTAAVWVVEPKRKTITMHEQGKSPRAFETDATLTAEELFPGLRIAVADVFK